MSEATDVHNDDEKSAPYNIIYEERCGRLLIAARDICAGEILFTDTPGAVGPDNNPKPVCLNCYKSLPGLVYRCRHCSFPLCSPFCQQDDGPHARECQLFRQHSPRSELQLFQVFCSFDFLGLILWITTNPALGTTLS